MSASLVGSEMCIRDRRCGIRSPPNIDAASRSRANEYHSLRPWLGTAAPVSYTHLTLPTICSV
eukprot:11694249-Alexandrium_andersonii.AAC.1